MKKSYGTDEGGKLLKSQTAVVRNYLEQGPDKRVTQKFVMDEWGFSRLSAIIYNIKEDLESEGAKKVVYDRRICVKNRFGNETYPKEYWIEDSTL